MEKECAIGLCTPLIDSRGAGRPEGSYESTSAGLLHEPIVVGLLV